MFWCIQSSSLLFVHDILTRKNVEFSAVSDDLVDIGDARLGNSECSVRIGPNGVDKLLTLQCNESNPVFEILKRDKIWGTICIGVPPPHTKFWGDSSPCPPVIYAHVHSSPTYGCSRY